MRILFLSLSILTATMMMACRDDNKTIKISVPEADTLAPPRTWQEHWLEHVQLMTNVSYNKNVAVYYDKDMDKGITWPLRISTAIWNYTKQRYGSFGKDWKTERLFVNLHFNKYGGGHPSTYYDASHDNRNTIDIGSAQSWTDSTGWNLDIVAHEVGHIVEGASKGVKESPAWDIWHDSKWMEIYQYDVYKNCGWPKEATRWYNDKMNTVDSYPRAGTQWFKNWFYPIYNNYGEGAVLEKFFTLLSQYFPQRSNSIGKEYTRRMNLGEFVHFWSGAAQTDLKQLALTAFGPLDEKGQDWVKQFETAQQTFSAITY